MTKCTVCKDNFGEDSGMYNSPIGWVCSDCGESKPWMETKRKQTDKKKKIQSRDFKVENTITIGKYSLDGKILKEYVEKVEYRPNNHTKCLNSKRKNSQKNIQKYKITLSFRFKGN